MPTPQARPWRAAVLATLFFAASFAVVGQAADAVILPDGLVIHGRWFKESELISDAATGSVRVVKAGGYDVVDDGPKHVMFSTHATKGARVEKDLAKPDFVAYTAKFYQLGNAKPLPPVVGTPQVGPFNEKWERTITVEVPATADAPVKGTASIKQQVVSLDPYWIRLNAVTHIWSTGYHTAEQPPELVLDLLRKHPLLKDTSGKVDPNRRLAIAEFLKDVGWLPMAKAELEKLKKDAPGPWEKEVTARHDKLVNDIDSADTRLLIDALEAAVAAGQYDIARKFLAGFKPNGKDAKETVRLGVIRTQVETVHPNYELTARLLRGVIDRELGAERASASAAVAGGACFPLAPRTKLPADLATLVAAASAVWAELHPDTSSRLELFRLSAKQEEDRRTAGKDPVTKPDGLLALAVTGWLKGKNGADPNVPAAIRCWETRQMALAYVSEEVGNNRVRLLDAYTKTGKPLSPDELAQIVTLLPPPFAQNMDEMANLKLPAAAGVEGVYKVKSAGTPELPQGVDYFLRLPPEYHHGRSYPVILALTSPDFPVQELMKFLGPYADRHGYVVAAPDWAPQFGANKRYDFSGNDHPLATATLRDLFRRFQVDPDKVFLYGLRDGANFAFDLGLSKPDLFAGLIAVGANPPLNFTKNFWHNAQKLPVYMVTGELAGSFSNHRVFYDKWLNKGYPALLTVYKGRGPELFPMELPRMFDWMGRKTRVRGAGVLRLGQAGFEPWQVLRTADDRFYWVGVGPGGLRNANMLGNPPAARAVQPAQFRADIGRAGVVNIDQAIGVRKFVIWLERDLIDWTKPLRVNINGQPAHKWTPKVLEPDLRVLFEEVYRTGDRKMLFLGKIEIDGPG